MSFPPNVLPCPYVSRPVLVGVSSEDDDTPQVLKLARFLLDDNARVCTRFELRTNGAWLATLSRKVGTLLKRAQLRLLGMDLDGRQLLVGGIAP